MVDNERNEAIWEEMAALLGRDTNVGVNFRLLMATAGVLALLPSAAIGGMALVLGDLGLAGRGFVRWGEEAGCVLLAGGLTLKLKRLTLHRRHVED